MTDPRPPAWQAVEIGPGGLDPLVIRPIGAGRAPDATVGRGAWPNPGRGAWPNVGHRPPAGPAPVPSAVMDHQPGYLEAQYPLTDRPDFNTGKTPSRWRRLRDSRHFGTIVIGVIITVILTSVIWATAVIRPDEISVGDCLTLGTLLPSEVGCEGPDAEFRVISRYDDTTDYTRCASDEPDAGLAAGNGVLCVNYVARVGDCLYADEGSNVGKELCSTRLDGLYQVIEVISNSLDANKCPDKTDQVLIHRRELEVICLIENP